MSRRLKTRDYASPGLYFVTICCDFKRSILGTVGKKSVQLTPLGKIAEEAWFAIPNHFEGVTLQAFVIMPNHLHGIIEIGALVAAHHAVPLHGAWPASTPRLRRSSLSVIIRSFKAEVTRRAHQELNRRGDVWQRNYFDRVIRDSREFSAATRYIVENPLQWEWDRENILRKAVPGERRLAQHAVPLQPNPWTDL